MLSRRTFIKGLAAAPFAASAITKLFSSEVSAPVPEESNPLYAGELGQYDGVVMYRHAVALGPENKVTVKSIRKARSALIDWVKRKRITADVNRVRFMYSVDDFGNEVGIGATIYDRPQKGRGMTWGQMEYSLKQELGLA